jgi:oligoendopeptidase F
MMNWDLASFFPTFGGDEMRAFKVALTTDLEALQSRAGALDTLDSDNADSWEGILVDGEDLMRRLYHMGAYLGCLTAADTASEEYKKEEAAFAQVYAEAEKLDVELMRGLKAATDDAIDELTGRPTLAGCGFYVRRLRDDAQKTMSPAEERLSADLGVDGLHAWGRLYDTLSGRLEFDMQWPDGRTERLPIAQRRSLLARADRAVRQAAFAGGNAAWEEVQDTTAAALNAIAGTRLSLNRHRGVDHFLDIALFQAKITRRSLDAMFEAIHSRADLARRILRLKADAMGTQGVAWYDLEAPLPMPGEERTLSWDEAKAQVQDAFSAAYPALGSFLGEMYEKQWIEWEPRQAKRPGAFCTGSLLTMEPRIYMTFQGSPGDVRTLAHEAGHAFHHHVLRQTRPYCHDYPMTLAESASTFGEMILTEGILSGPAVSDEDKLRVLDMETAHGAVYLMDIPVRFEFERAFHEERQAGEVEVSRLRELMTQTQQRLFGDTLEEGGDDPLFWASKLHFYITGVTFYNFPYTFGFLLSRGLFARFREEGDAFLPRYEEFLRSTGSDTAENVARESLGVDIESPEFWVDAIDTLGDAVEQLEGLWGRLGKGAAGKERTS